MSIGHHGHVIMLHFQYGDRMSRTHSLSQGSIERLSVSYLDKVVYREPDMWKIAKWSFRQKHSEERMSALVGIRIRVVASTGQHDRPLHYQGSKPLIAHLIFNTLYCGLWNTAIFHRTSSITTHNQLYIHIHQAMEIEECPRQPLQNTWSRMSCP